MMSPLTCVRVGGEARGSGSQGKKKQLGSYEYIRKAGGKGEGKGEGGGGRGR